MEYFKINSLWKRKGWYFDQEKKKSPDYQKGRQSFNIGDYACEEFGNVKKWHVEEKIDGTNIRVIFKDRKVSFGGRTKNANIPALLLENLMRTFTDSLMQARFCKDGNMPHFILFGEGYGPKIQKAGSSYRSDPGFILFDVWCQGWWLKREDVKDVADQFDIPCAPKIGIMTEEEVVAYVKSKPMSLCSEKPQVMEGVICRADPLLLFRNGKPVLWKLKCKEFENG